MKTWKKCLAAVLSLAIMASATACSGADKSWAVKNDNLTVPIGAYIYNPVSYTHLVFSFSTYCFSAPIPIRPSRLSLDNGKQPFDFPDPRLFFARLLVFCAYRCV